LKDLSECNPDIWEVRMALAGAYERDRNSEEAVSFRVSNEPSLTELKVS
jgi:hypothetical protein